MPAPNLSTPVNRARAYDKRERDSERKGRVKRTSIKGLRKRRAAAPGSDTPKEKPRTSTIKESKKSKPKRSGKHIFKKRKKSSDEQSESLTRVAKTNDEAQTRATESIKPVVRNSSNSPGEWAKSQRRLRTHAHTMPAWMAKEVPKDKT